MAQIINFSDTSQPTDDALTDLQDLLNDKLQGVETEIAKHMQSAAELIPAISDHLIGAGGKRLRPLLTLSAARISGYHGKDDVTMAAAVEFCIPLPYFMMMSSMIAICAAAKKRPAPFGEIRPAFWSETFCWVRRFA